jgi:hypothetical protein
VDPTAARSYDAHGYLPFHKACTLVGFLTVEVIEAVHVCYPVAINQSTSRGLTPICCIFERRSEDVQNWKSNGTEVGTLRFLHRYIHVVDARKYMFNERQQPPPAPVVENEEGVNESENEGRE